MKRSAAVPSVLALLVVVATAVTADMVPPSFYTMQEDVNSDFIKQVGTFAVNVYKMAHMIRMYYKYTLQCWSGSEPGSGGANYYWMVLTATNSTGAAGQYVAIVYGIPGSESKTWKLLRFNSAS